VSNIQLVIDSNLENVWMVGVTINRLCALVLDQTACNEVELAVVEAVNNCIEHAYRQDDGHQVKVTLEIGAEAVEIDVEDEGEPLDRELVDKIKADGLSFDPADMDNLPEGGMGWFLINSMMDEVHYDSAGGRNVLSMIKNITIS
jgi:serine/threonine-protein kinase RsbW